MTGDRAGRSWPVGVRWVLRRIVLPLVLVAAGITIFLVLTGIIAEPGTLLESVFRAIFGE